MSLVRRFLDKINRPRIIIDTPDGPVTESMRRQAAINMRRDPLKRRAVEAVVIRECGGDPVRGLAECKRRYPEAYS